MHINSVVSFLQSNKEKALKLLKLIEASSTTDHALLESPSPEIPIKGYRCGSQTRSCQDKLTTIL